MIKGILLTRKGIVLTAIMLLSVWCFIYFFVQHTYYTISGSPSTVSYLTEDGYKIPKRLFSLYMVPRSSDVVQIIAGQTVERIYTGDRSFFGINHLQPTLTTQRQVNRIGTGGLDCLGRYETKYFSYSCYGGSNDIFTFAEKSKDQYDNQLVDIDTIDTKISTVPYKAGLLSVVSKSQLAFLQYVNIADKTTDTILLPTKEYESLEVATEQGSETIIVIDNTYKKIYHYASFSSEPSVIPINQGVSYNDCIISDKKVLCSQSKVEETTVYNTEDHSVAGESKEKSEIITYDVPAKSYTTFTTGGPVESICHIGEKTYYLQSDELYVRHKNRTSLIALDVSQIACKKQGVEYVENGRLYTLHMNSNASLTFKSSKLAVSTIQSTGDKVVFTAFDSDDPHQTRAAYEITSNKASNGRIENILPYSSSDLPILEMDYDTSTIYIKPSVFITSNSQTGEMTIDQKDLARKKQLIEAQLREDGLLGNYRLVYYF